MAVIGSSVRAHKWFIVVFALTVVALLSLSLPSANSVGTAKQDDAPVRHDKSAAVAAANVLNKPVEIRSERTADSQTFANPDGSMTERIAVLHDTWVRPGTNAIKGWSHRLVVGKVHDESNRNPASTFIRFRQARLAELSDKIIKKATLSVWQYESGSCSPRTVNLAPLKRSFSESSTKYANRPPVRLETGDDAVLTANKGRNNCPRTTGGNNGYVTADITGMATAWVKDEYPNWGLQMSVPASANGTYERRFCSRNAGPKGGVCAKPNRTPIMKITYVENLNNTKPNVPTDLKVNGEPCGAILGRSVNSPMVEALVSDPDEFGGLVAPYFQWSVGGSVDPSAPVVAGPWLGSGTVGRISLPIPTTDGTYSFRVKAKDQEGAWSAYSPDCVFTVDTSVPSTPSIANMPDVWEPGHSYDIVFSPGDNPEGTAGYRFGFDSDVPPTTPLLPAEGAGHTHTYTLTLPEGSGFSSLNLWAYDDAGNMSEPYLIYIQY